MTHFEKARLRLRLKNDVIVPEWNRALRYWDRCSSIGGLIMLAGILTGILAPGFAQSLVGFLLLLAGAFVALGLSRAFEYRAERMRKLAHKTLDAFSSEVLRTHEDSEATDA